MCHVEWLISLEALAHCGLVMPYGNIDLGQPWLRQWLVAWCHQAITSTNVDLSSKVFCGIHQRTISHVNLQGPQTIFEYCSLTHWPLEDVTVILKVYFSNSLCGIVAWALVVKLFSVEGHSSSLMKVNIGSDNALVPSCHFDILMVMLLWSCKAQV